MQIKLAVSYILTFLLLTIVMLELHEITHIVVGRLICGCWGTRDFNVWALCAACNHPSLSWLATISGPVFSFAMMWLGAWMLRSPIGQRKAIGFSLIFANIPFGRISEVIKGSGDEMVVARHFLQDSFTPTQTILICSAIVLLLGSPPIIVAYRSINNKYTWLYFVGFLTLPIAFILIYFLIAMNTLLKNGFLSENGIMGTPLLISLHTMIAMVLLGVFWKRLDMRNGKL